MSNAQAAKKPAKMWFSLAMRLVSNFEYELADNFRHYSDQELFANAEIFDKPNVSRCLQAEPWRLQAVALSSDKNIDKNIRDAMQDLLRIAYCQAQLKAVQLNYMEKAEARKQLVTLHCNMIRRDATLDGINLVWHSKQRNLHSNAARQEQGASSKKMAAKVVVEDRANVTRRVNSSNNLFPQSRTAASKEDATNSIRRLPYLFSKLRSLAQELIIKAKGRVKSHRKQVVTGCRIN